MFDVWIGDTELTTLVLIFSIIVVLPIQLLLCFKIKSLFVRLLPIIVFTTFTIIFVIMSFNIDVVYGLGYTFLASFSGFMLFMSGISWGIWAITKSVKKRKNEE